MQGIGKIPPLEDTGETQGSQDTRRIVNCDQEVWIKDRIYTALMMAQALFNNRKVSAADDQYLYGVDGIIEGTAVAIIGILGMRPEYKNLRKRPK